VRHALADLVEAFVCARLAFQAFSGWRETARRIARVFMLAVVARATGVAIADTGHDGDGGIFVAPCSWCGRHGKRAEQRA
jgi:hypothetical protein